MSSDAQNSFVYLHDNIPKWTESLSVLRLRMSEKSSEHELITVKRKNDSAESIHLDKPAANTQHPSIDPIPPSNAAQQPSASPSSPIPAKRKRNTPSLVSISGASRYRTRQMVVVYYDSEIQKAFEELVRGIGVSRNQIRKGRNAARLEAMANLTANLDADDDDVPMATSKMGPKLGLGGFRSTRARGLPRAAGSNNKLFDEMDGILEKAQNLCERAAHQYLRDGNALMEIDRTKTQFEELYQLCDREMARKKEEAEKAEEEGTDERAEKPSTSATLPSTRPSKTILPSVGLEVDDDLDDDDDSDPIVLPPIRLTSRA